MALGRALTACLVCSPLWLGRLSGCWVGHRLGGPVSSPLWLLGRHFGHAVGRGEALSACGVARCGHEGCGVWHGVAKCWPLQSCFSPLPFNLCELRWHPATYLFSVVKPRKLLSFMSVANVTEVFWVVDEASVCVVAACIYLPIA